MRSLVNMPARTSSQSTGREDHRTERRQTILWIAATWAAAVVAAGVLVVVAPAHRAAPTVKRGRQPASPNDALPVGGTPAGPSGVTADWVQQENAKPGTDQWRLAPHQRQGVIEGYADHVSVEQGDTVTL